MLICPNADHTDGQLDITMVHSASRTRLIRLFPTVYKGTHVNLDQVTHGAGNVRRRGIAGYQRLRRRRLCLRAARRDLRGAGRTADPAES